MHVMGSRTRTRTRGAGTFRCPRERATRRYDAKVVQRWLAVGAVPVIRRDEIGGFIECHGCGSTFDMDVLARRDDAPVEDMLTRTLRRTVSALLGQRELTAEDRREAVIVLQRYATVPYGSHDLRRDLDAADPDHLDADLRALAPSLNDRGRTAILDAGIQLARPAGRTDPTRLASLERVAELLAIPTERIAALTGSQPVRIAG